MKAVSGHHTGNLGQVYFLVTKKALETREEKRQHRAEEESTEMPFKKPVISPKADGKIASSGSKMPT